MGRGWLANIGGIVLALVLVAAVVALWRVREDDSTRVVFVPGILGVGTGAPRPSLYPPNDPWKAYLAPERVCPGGERRDRPRDAQERTMLCLLNYARKRRGLPALVRDPFLDRAAELKARDIARCGDFAHEACGKPPDAVVAEAEYAATTWGENLALGSGLFGSPRVMVSGWLNSEGHRDNLFRTSWTEQGVALLAVDAFDGERDVAIWVSHFGRR